MSESLKTRLMRWGFNFFPAFRRMGARITYIADDWHEVHIQLPLNWKTKNYVGTIFGGSMYGAVDPIYMVMFIKLLGPEYIVRDKAASIQFKNPGRSTLRAKFRIEDQELAAIREELQTRNRIDRGYQIELRDIDNNLCALIEKQFILKKEHEVARRDCKKSETGQECKKMRIYYFHHVPFEGLGNIENWIKSQNYELSATRFYAADPLPQLHAIDGLIIMGGPMGNYEDKKYPWLAADKSFIEASIQAGKKVLGICLGAQLIASVLGAKVYPHIHKEIGWCPLKLTDEGMESKIFQGFPVEFPVFHWHGDTFSFPAGAARLAETTVYRNQAFAYGNKVIGLQFHLDVARESVEQLIENCAAELVNAPYIQTREQLLQPAAEFGEIRKYKAAG